MGEAEGKAWWKRGAEGLAEGQDEERISRGVIPFWRSQQGVLWGW